MDCGFERLEAFLMWLGVTEKIEVAACKKNVQIRNDKTIIGVVGGTQWDKANRSTPVRLFIGQTCPRAGTDDDEQLDSEKLMWFPHHKKCVCDC